MGTNNVEFFNRIIFQMRTYLLLRLQFMLINTYMDLFNWVYVNNYTKFEHFWPKCPVYGEKSSFFGYKVEFYSCKIFYMRTYLLLRLQFMLINTYISQIYMINYTIFEHFWPKCPVYEISPVLLVKKSSFLIVLYFTCVHTFFSVCNSCLLTHVWIYSTRYI